MEKVKIIADSGCNIDLDMAKEYDISILPFNINFKDKSYTDLYELSREDFFIKYKESKERVTTSMPSPGKFLKLLEEEYQKGYRNFIVFSITKKFSGIYQMMDMMKEEFVEENPDARIKVIDTNTATIAAIYPVIKAAIYAKDGMGLDEIYKKSLDNLKYCNVAGVVKNLDALVRGGRLPKTIAKLANLISFSPVLCIEDGEIKLIKKVTGKKKSYKELIKYLKKLCKKYKDYQIIIGGADSSDEIEILKEGLSSEIENALDFKIIDVTAVIGSHLGDGVIFCSIFPIN
ncbi:DegV family protein [Anaerococcus vaginalis]|uniref:EDD domain protein, DegV family n=2 Tax=Anaerococcus vaginalis TaxID=33037 RepID=C7HWQ0_9FIRM|nr:DegV family protein [Anaerococcus vaginalis]EEU11832.1 EDD domain protein, DegV family [Anaerococcus vaginalis ATCC 51170]QQB62021.1 DegV family protein [Anaerococcus vaginalis]